MKPAVFLDRDNTLIPNDGDLGDPEQVRLFQGTASAVASLRGLGYRIVVVTNQGGVARGKYTEDDVKAVHGRLAALIEKGANGAHIDGFYYCPYHPEGTIEQYCQEHPTRKPQPGMLLQAAKDLDLDLSQSWMIGDAVRDVEAGAAVGARTILLQRGGRARVSEQSPERPPDFVAGSLVEAVRIVAQQRKPEVHEPREGSSAGASTGPALDQFGPRKWDAAAVAQLQQQPDRAESQAKSKARSGPATGGGAAPAEQADDESQSDQSKSASRSRRDDAQQDDAHADPGPGPGAGPGGSGQQQGRAQASQANSSTRPFRPWGAPPLLEDPPTHQDRQGSPGRETGSAAADVADSAEKGSAAERGAARAQTQVQGQGPGAEDQRSGDADTPETRHPTSDQPQPEPARPMSSATPPAELTLRQILQELRNQRTGGEFSYLRVVAIVLQMIAGLCLLGALWMGAYDGDVFWRWMSTGLLMQGATIAVLLFGRPE